MAGEPLSQSGIYCIRNIVSGRVYVGSAVKMAARRRGGDATFICFALASTIPERFNVRGISMVRKPSRLMSLKLLQTQLTLLGASNIGSTFLMLHVLSAGSIRRR